MDESLLSLRIKDSGNRHTRRQEIPRANANGTQAEKLVASAALRFVDDANFRAAVLEAKAYADRGEFIEEDEMEARFQFRPP